jgi:hypothetical protein
MTEVTRWLIGLVCISGLPALWYLGLTLFLQFRSGEVTWRDSAPTRLALSMVMLGVALGGFALAAAVSPTTEPKPPSAYIVWGSWGVAWLSALVAISGLRKGVVPTNLACCALWTISLLTYQGVFA